ncbi:MAG: hypothetical protein PHW53_03865 [Patescibacteria group bacterium]|nr:hypothetical protein [Patescibacteria group bacterium]
MSPFQKLTNIRHEIKRQDTFLKLFKITNLNIVAMILVMIMGGFYLVQVNKVTTKGYKIRDLEKKIQAIEDSSRKVELEIAELQSLDSVEERVKTLGMVPVENVRYVKKPGAVAVNR